MTILRFLALMALSFVPSNSGCGIASAWPERQDQRRQRTHLLLDEGEELADVGDRGIRQAICDATYHDRVLLEAHLELVAHREAPRSEETRGVLVGECAFYIEIRCAAGTSCELNGATRS